MKRFIALLCLAVLLLSGCAAEPSTPGKASLPALMLHQGDQSLEANIGSYNWQMDNGDGTCSAVCVDAAHPLDIAESLPLLEAKNCEVQLEFFQAPESILVWCWETEDADAQLIPSDGTMLSLMPGTHVYQITATWPGTEGFTNIVHYSFRADVTIK